MHSRSVQGSRHIVTNPAPMSELQFVNNHELKGSMLSSPGLVSSRDEHGSADEQC
jgi:hypothetical protein